MIVLNISKCLKLISSHMQSKKQFHQNCKLFGFYYEKDPKYGYSKIDANRKIPLKEKIEICKEGIQDLKGEIKKWKEEVKDTLHADPQISMNPGETEIIWNLNESALNDWIVSCDSDHGEGFSSASLTVSPKGHALFSGLINTQTPQDGRLQRTGYCNLKSVRARRSFFRPTNYEWPGYTHLVIRCRGDGRSYLVNLHCPGDYDISWGDLYSYNLYTRGGPYWQITKIPFSKFYFQSKGRIQDMQDRMLADIVSSIGFTMADKNNGPFQLEIDYIGIEYDPTHSEEFAYELYLFENEVRGIVNQ